MKIINKRNIIILVAFLLVLIVFISILAKKHSNSNKGRVVAVVDKLVVYEDDLKDRIASLDVEKNTKLEDLPENVIRAMVLEVLVNEKIDKSAKKLGYKNDKQIKKFVENYEKGLMREKYLNDNIYSKITDKNAQDEYTKLVENLKGQEERKVKHILVGSEEEIERVRRNVMRTGNFEKIAKERSIDTASAENGGDIGYVLKDELVPEFGNMVFILKVGEISKPVETQYGWHIIKVEDIRPAQFLPFEEVKEGIKQRLQQQAIQDYLLSLTKDSKVTFKIDTKQIPNEGINNLVEEINQEELVIE